jgi:hypothetical protein
MKKSLLLAAAIVVSFSLPVMATETKPIDLSNWKQVCAAGGVINIACVDEFFPELYSEILYPANRDSEESEGS